MGVFPSGQRGQTVNLLRFASVVRIHPLPPDYVPDFTVRHIFLSIHAGLRVFFRFKKGIKKAQTARGARFESRRLTDKAASVAPLVVPIFLSAFRRADELSMAMEARGYRNAGSRTKKDRHALHLPDYLALTASMMICAASVFIF